MRPSYVAGEVKTGGGGIFTTTSTAQSSTIVPGGSLIPRINYGGGGNDVSTGLGATHVASPIMYRPITASSLLSPSSVYRGLAGSAANGDEGRSYVGQGYAKYPLQSTPPAPRSGSVANPQGGGALPKPSGDGDSDVVVVDDVQLPPYPDEEDDGVVPQDLLRPTTGPTRWDGHPSSSLVLLLLNARGIFLPQSRQLIEYHMAEDFLNDIAAVQQGAFFMKFAQTGSPKERFVTFRMLKERSGQLAAHLCWQLHEKSFQIVSSIPLADMVGVRTGPNAPCYRRFMVSHDTIRGCRVRGQKTTVPTEGALSVWFHNKKANTSTVIGLLTTNELVLNVWYRCLQGIAAVNTASLVDGSVKVDPLDEQKRLLALTETQITNTPQGPDPYADDDGATSAGGE